jgi:hypothetical protein
VLCAKLPGFRDRLFVGAGAEDDDGNIPKIFEFFDLEEELAAVHAGHVQVEKDEIRFDEFVGELIQGFAAVFGDVADERRGVLADDGEKNFTVVFIVVDEHDVIECRHGRKIGNEALFYSAGQPFTIQFPGMRI